MNGVNYDETVSYERERGVGGVGGWGDGNRTRPGARWWDATKSVTEGMSGGGVQRAGGTARRRVG